MFAQYSVALFECIFQGNKEEEVPPTPAAEEAKPVSIGSRSAKPFDLAEYTKHLKEKNAESQQVVKDPKSLLANLSGIGISIAPKSAVKAETKPEGNLVFIGVFISRSLMASYIVGLGFRIMPLSTALVE